MKHVNQPLTTINDVTEATRALPYLKLDKSRNKMSSPTFSTVIHTIIMLTRKCTGSD